MNISNRSSPISKFKKNKLHLNESNAVNFNGWYSSTLITQSGTSIIEPYIPLFAQSIGASNSQIGLLTGLFALINITQLIWAQLAIKIGNNKFFVFFGQMLMVTLYIPMAFLKLGYFIILLVVRFFQGFFNSAAIPSLATLQSDYISEHDRASKVAKFTYLGLVGSFVGTLVGGYLFDYLNTIISPEETYSLMFVFSAIIGFLGTIVFFLSVPSTTKLLPLRDLLDPVSFINRDLKFQKSNIKFSTKIRNYIKKFKNFWFFTIFGVIFYFGVYTISPFFIIIEIVYFQLSFIQASLLTAISVVAQVTVSITLVRKNLINKYGRKPFLFLGMVLILMFTILLAVPYYFQDFMSIDMRFYFCFISWIVLGLGWGLFNSTIAVLLLDIVHPQYRSLLIAVFNAFSGISMFVAPIIGGLLIDFTHSLLFSFILRFVLIFVSILFFIKMVKEPEISGIELKPIRNVFPFIGRMSAKGPELGIAYGNERMIRKKHL